MTMKNGTGATGINHHEKLLSYRADAYYIIIPFSAMESNSADMILRIHLIIIHMFIHAN